MKVTKKWVMAVCMSSLLLIGVTGCAKTTESQQQAREEIGNGIDNQVIPEETEKRADDQKEQEKTNHEDHAIDQENVRRADEEPNKAENARQADEESNKAENARQAGEEPKEAENAQTGQTEPLKYMPSEGTEHLGGTVQSLEDDGMVLAQTTVMGEDDSTVILVDEKDAKKIPVKFTADTKVEHWIIQGGGAGIDRKNAELSDLKAGIGVELEGFYEGDTFVATRILIEEYK